MMPRSLSAATSRRGCLARRVVVETHAKWLRVAADARLHAARGELASPVAPHRRACCTRRAGWSRSRAAHLRRARAVGWPLADVVGRGFGGAVAVAGCVASGRGDELVPTGDARRSLAASKRSLAWSLARRCGRTRRRRRLIPRIAPVPRATHRLASRSTRGRRVAVDGDVGGRGRTVRRRSTRSGCAAPRRSIPPTRAHPRSSRSRASLSRCSNASRAAARPARARAGLAGCSRTNRCRCWNAAARSPRACSSSASDSSASSA